MGKGLLSGKIQLILTYNVRSSVSITVQYIIIVINYFLVMPMNTLAVEFVI